MGERCVRVDPPVLEFKGVEVGQVYRRTVTVTNVGKTSKKIIIEKPGLKLFDFILTSQAEFVPSGLSVSGLLEFTPDAEEEVRDHIQVHVDDVETLHIPVLGSPRVCSLITDSLLDFGCVVASNQVVSKLHPITNEGSAPGAFQVEYSSGESSLSVSPSSGVVAAGTTQWLKVELQTGHPRQIHVKALVRLQNRSAVILRIRAEVVEQHLEVVDLKGYPLTCLWFGPIYFGTFHVKKVVVRNNAPQVCDWVCLQQENVAGTEMGTDLQRGAEAALVERMRKCSPADHDGSQVLVCVPSHGRLGPYDRTTVAVCFSPVCKRKKHENSGSRQDYCLFLLFDIVDSKHGFTHQNANSSVEVAVTGSGVPVSLVPTPSHRFDFLSCAIGQSLDLLCVLQNLCPHLPVSFRFSKVAHFTAEPSAGTIGPGQCQDVVLTFSARQQGRFYVRQKIDVLGCVVSRKDATEVKVSCFHTITLHLSAICHNVTTHPLPGFQSAAGLQPHIQCSELSHCWGLTRVAVLSSDKTQLHKHHRDKRGSTKGTELLAFPDDRACSIRPGSSDKQYRTIFTGVPRYRYVDKDYAFTEEEEEQRRRHRQVYMDFIKQLRQRRLQRIKERQQEKVQDDVDIGIVPCQGLVPPTVHIRDLEINKNSTSQGSSNQVIEAMKTVPSTSQEVADCNRTLTALELYQVIISPLFVDFGSVCVQSVCAQTLQLINRLSVYVWVQLEVDCPELQGSSPLSYVLPPHSSASFPLTFESKQLGPFRSSMSYQVNQQHPGQIILQAQVTPMSLELSTKLLVLRPTPNTLAASGYRSSVSLRNQCNCAVDFTWQPAATESDFMFSIRPATGTVEPYSELDCEVVWFPSFSSPAEGDFDLCVHKVNTQRLHCVAKVGPTTVQLAEKRIVFESVPLNITSTRTAVLHNTGENHAYYQVFTQRRTNTVSNFYGSFILIKRERISHKIQNKHITSE
ncbi:cilia- and flagella-associated protein 47-like [Kryptolebias marmoratus]|uniref:cilia- and flagella-associated protein 47-like n=1 Tax=Kryptolebias marmoratus TaxID=37003 RepID=UPI0018AC9B48|nr:cilia- and flagella-associated protein 47-like [Kryptolebias marmoratus]